MTAPTFSTKHGDLHLRLEPEPRDLERMSFAWPYGVARLESPDGALRYGIIFQRGEREIWGLKLQQPDAPVEVAMARLAVNRVRATAAAARIVGKHSDASLLVGTYFRERAEGQLETGIALFPMYLGEAAPPTDHAGPGALVTRIMPGGEAIVSDFLGALLGDADADHGAIAPLIGLDLRPRLAIGNLILEVLVVGDWIANIYPEVAEADPRWAALVGGGVTRLVHLPSVTFATEA